MGVKAGLTAEVHVVLTDMDIEKKPAEPNLITDGRKVVNAVKARLGRSPARTRCGG